MSDLSLDQLAAFAEIIGAGSIITGLIIGVLQIRAHRSQQRDRVATNLMQTFYNPEFSKAIVLLYQLPDGISTADMRQRGPEFEDAAVVVSTALETMGLLAYKKITQFDLVMELVGGMVVVIHRKLAEWLREKRETQNHPGWGEWFEWLAMRAEEHLSDKTPAYQRTGDWRP
jgi:hypothetical protein